MQISWRQIYARYLNGESVNNTSRPLSRERVFFDLFIVLESAWQFWGRDSCKHSAEYEFSH